MREKHTAGGVFEKHSGRGKGVFDRIASTAHSIGHAADGALHAVKSGIELGSTVKGLISAGEAAAPYLAAAAL